MDDDDFSDSSDDGSLQTVESVGETVLWHYGQGEFENAYFSIPEWLHHWLPVQQSRPYESRDGTWSQELHFGKTYGVCVCAHDLERLVVSVRQAIVERVLREYYNYTYADLALPVLRRTG